MANRTIAQKIAVLEARRDKLEAAVEKAETGIQSFGLDGLNAAFSSPQTLQTELTRVEKSLQRLYRGGRGIQIDLSQNGLDQSEVINTTYTQVGV